MIEKYMMKSLLRHLHRIAHNLQRPHQCDNFLPIISRDIFSLLRQLFATIPSVPWNKNHTKNEKLYKQKHVSETLKMTYNSY